MFDLSKCSALRLDASTQILPFDCGDPDLNEFLLQDALGYAENLLAVTNIFEFGGRTAAFYCVLNDKITVTDFGSRRAYRRFLNAVPDGKQHSSVPAVKIGRLGVDTALQGRGVGTQILDHIKVSFTTRNKTGCRFVTVDAYNNSATITFYARNGFRFMAEDECLQKTRLMCFDLMTFIR